MHKTSAFLCSSFLRIMLDACSSILTLNVTTTNTEHEISWWKSGISKLLFQWQIILRSKHKDTDINVISLVWGGERFVSPSYITLNASHTLHIYVENEKCVLMTPAFTMVNRYHVCRFHVCRISWTNSIGNYFLVVGVKRKSTPLICHGRSTVTATNEPYVYLGVFLFCFGLVYLFAFCFVNVPWEI